MTLREWSHEWFDKDLAERKKAMATQSRIMHVLIDLSVYFKRP